MALEQPKRPVGGAYGQFIPEKRQDFMKACAGQRASAVSQMAGKAWKELSDAQKKPYEEKFAVAKAKYDEDLKAFLDAGGEKSKGQRALRSEKRKGKEGRGNEKVKDPNKPKVPAGGAYGVFLAENRAKIVESLPKDHKMVDVAKAAGQQWKALSDAAKQPYEATYAKKMEEYKKAMETYVPPVRETATEDDSGKTEKADKQTPSKKRAAAEKATPTPQAKRGRGAAGKKAAASKEPEVDGKVLKEAESLKLLSQLKNLMARPDVAASGKSQEAMLDALKQCDGLVNKAKSALLGA